MQSNTHLIKVFAGRSQRLDGQPIDSPSSHPQAGPVSSSTSSVTMSSESENDQKNRDKNERVVERKLTMPHPWTFFTGLGFRLRDTIFIDRGLSESSTTLPLQSVSSSPSSLLEVESGQRRPYSFSENLERFQKEHEALDDHQYNSRMIQFLFAAMDKFSSESKESCPAPGTGIAFYSGRLSDLLRPCLDIQPSDLNDLYFRALRLYSTPSKDWDEKLIEDYRIVRQRVKWGELSLPQSLTATISCRFLFRLVRRNSPCEEIFPYDEAIMACHRYSINLSGEDVPVNWILLDIEARQRERQSSPAVPIDFAYINLRGAKLYFFESMLREVLLYPELIRSRGIMHVLSRLTEDRWGSNDSHNESISSFMMNINFRELKMDYKVKKELVAILVSKKDVPIYLQPCIDYFKNWSSAHSSGSFGKKLPSSEKVAIALELLRTPPNEYGTFIASLPLQIKNGQFGQMLQDVLAKSRAQIQNVDGKSSPDEKSTDQFDGVSPPAASSATTGPKI